jgi:ketosteroid isomerase-like protein
MSFVAGKSFERRKESHMRPLLLVVLMAIAATAQTALPKTIVSYDQELTTANLQAAPNEQPPSQACNDSLESSYRAAIEEVIEQYRAAWLRGDAGGVLQTFTDSSVLLPAGGAEPVIGLGKIKEYWWPKDAPETKILQLDISVDQIEGDNCFAFARGSDTVAWSTLVDGKLTRSRHRGRFLNAMQKMPDGSWRILQHMWDDQPNENF